MPTFSRRAAGALLLAALPALAACGEKAAEAAPLTNLKVERRNIVVDAQATGAVEPINIIEVKSQAGGQILRMPVETGDNVQPGDLIVQVDTRDLKNQQEQAAADVRSAEAALEVARLQRERSAELYKARIITAQENEQADLSYTQAQAQVIRARTNLDLANQRLEQARVVAPVTGTVIEKLVSEGQVIQSATGAFGEGTILVRMADLTRVQMRAFVNETDIGKIKPGQEARVVVDAFPERPFRGTVEKIEPQAVVQQSVTMFPVIISLPNQERLLMPGMNGEVSVSIERKTDVLAVGNDAVRSMREAAQAAEMLGLDPESVTAMLRGAGNGAPANGNARNDTAGAGRPVQVPGGAAAGGAPGSAAAGGAPAGATAGGPPAGARRPGGMGGARRNGASGSRAAVVFLVRDSGVYEPRLVRLGASDYDYSEVISGLEEGDEVASLALAALEAARQERLRRFSGFGGVPGMSRSSGSGGSGGGRGGR
jgi:HlyD family secretion protein